MKSTSTSYLTSTVFAKEKTVKTTVTSVKKTTTSGKATTVRPTETAFVTTTVSGKDTTIKSTSTVFGTTTLPAKTSTVKATTTNVIISTYTPKAATVTDNQGGIVTMYKTSTQKGTTATSVTTVSGADVTKTTTLKVVFSVRSLGLARANKFTGFVCHCFRDFAQVENSVNHYHC